MERVGRHGSVLAPPQQLGRRHLEIHLGRVWLQGELTIPDAAKGIVLIAHGEMNSRLSTLHQFIASALNQAGIATCLFDLLSLEETQADQAQYSHCFDIALLGQRLIEITDWLDHYLEYSLPLGYLGINTAAAAAPIAASARVGLVKAVVSLSGRADMAVEALHHVQAPTLLIVGGLDSVLVELNRLAYRHLPHHCQKELVVVEEADPLFEASDTLTQAAQYAVRWFARYLGSES